MLSMIDATNLPEVSQWLNNDLDLESGRIHVVARAVRMGDIVHLVAQHKPNIILLSTGFGDPRALASILPDMKKASPKTRLIILHGHSSDATSKLLTLAANLGYYDFIGPFATVSDVADLIDHPRTYQEALSYPLLDSSMIQFQEYGEEERDIAADPEPPEPVREEPAGMRSLFDRVHRGNPPPGRLAAVSSAVASVPQVVQTPPPFGLSGASATKSALGAKKGRRMWLPMVALMAILVLAGAGIVFYKHILTVPSEVGTTISLNQSLVQPPTGADPGWVNPNNLPQTAGLALKDLLERQFSQYGNLMAALQLGAPPNLRNTLITAFPKLKNVGGHLTAKVLSGTATVLEHTPNTGLVKVDAVMNVYAGGQLAENQAQVSTTYSMQKIQGIGWRVTAPSILGVTNGVRTVGGGLGCT